MATSEERPRTADNGVENPTVPGARDGWRVASNTRDSRGDAGPARGISLAAQAEGMTGVAPQSSSQHDGTEQLRSRETILVVEDEDAVRRIACTILRRSGYTVIDAATPRRACEIFEEQGPGIDLLLTDVVMPGMNGPSLAQRLVGERPELRVLFMSGYVDVPTPFDAGSPNVTLLNKPFQSSTLLAKVQEVLTRPRTTP